MKNAFTKLANACASFRKDETGTGTLDFMMVLPAAMFFAATSYESGTYGLRNVMLERAVDVTVRQVRIGAIPDPTHAQLKERICEEAAIIPECMANVKLEMIRKDPRSWTDVSEVADCNGGIRRRRPCACVNFILCCGAILMTNMKSLRGAYDRFRKDDNGSAAVELTFMVPALALITFSMIVFFSAFRAQTHATRTATVVTDMISREIAPVTPAFLQGVEGLMKTMVHSDETPEFRVTAFTYDAEEETYAVAWSKHNGLGSLDDGSLNAVADQLPVLRDGQRALLVQTAIDYTPALDVGIGSQRFENFNVTAPRFVPQLCYMSDPNGDPETAEC